MPRKNPAVASAAALLGRRGGKANTRAQADTRRANGYRSQGRPRTLCACSHATSRHRWNGDRPCRDCACRALSV